MIGTMINFNFDIANPFSTRFDSLFCLSGGLTKNKSWEIQALRDSNWLHLEFRLTTRGDHAGLVLALGIFGYTLALQYYDHRHWDWDKNTWVDYE